MGGSQRLTRAIGKAKAMDLILTGRNMDAEEAERAGLVARVVPAADPPREAKGVAATIAGMSLSAARMGRGRQPRLRSTRPRACSTNADCSTSRIRDRDQKEGMAASPRSGPPISKHR